METAVKTKSGKQTVQKVGRFMSGMIMPNIGAFIAWGFLTTLFIPAGWLPHEGFATMVGPMLRFLIPLLVGYTGGKMVGGMRGGVAGAVATMGVIVGTEVTMIMGAMLIGPLAGWCVKVFDRAVEGKIRAGFEMLVDNFGLGLIAMLLALLGYVAIGPIVQGITAFLTAGATFINDIHVLPGISLFVEPGKVLFLNNAINHGIMGPIGAEQVKEFGKSIMYLVETNPGPGLGVLLACWLFGKGNVKASAPGAVIIHFLGGIHEIYFPYILANPALLLSVIAGGASGLTIFSLFNAGLNATPAPGSIFMLIAMSPRSDIFIVLLGVLVSAAVSMLVSIPFVKRQKADDLEGAAEQVGVLKAQSKGTAPAPAALRTVSGLIAFACDAGMGSSAMGATTLKKKLRDAGIDMPVKHYAIEDIPNAATVVVTQASLSARAHEKAPQAKLYAINNFMNATEYDKLIAELKDQ
ncbi:MAG TPA: PTS mannitol transporter subunit IICB [Feifaniaceae bacterium]|nr:PTS mannitol transporter subunit IICB [Feifaniaceae bacterium]